MDQGLFATSHSWWDRDVHAFVPLGVAFQNTLGRGLKGARKRCGTALKTVKTLRRIHLKLEASRFWDSLPGFRRSVFTLLWRTLPRGHPGEREIGGQHDGLATNDQKAAAVDSRKHQFDHRHRDDGREPDHSAPGRGEPEPDRGDELDHREIDGRGLPGHRLVFERIVLAADEARDLRP